MAMLHDRRPRLWIPLALAVGLVVSIALNVALMVRYQIPHRLWQDSGVAGKLRPEISLRKVLDHDDEAPALAAPGSVSSVEELRRWQASGRRKLQELLGITLPTGEPVVRRLRREESGGIVRETLVFEQHDGLEVPAFLLAPAREEQRANLLVIPGHSRGIVATAGLVEDYQHSNALRLAEAGYVVLTMEVRGFGYLKNLTAGDHPMDKGAFMGLSLMHGRTPLGVTVRDAATGLNYLATRLGTSADRLGVVGFSSGCLAAIYLGGLVENVEAVVASGCVSSHDASFRYGRNDSYQAVPGLAKWLELSDCLGLLAPRPVLVHWGERDNDPGSRSAAFNESSLDIYEAAGRIYAAAGHPESLEKWISPDMGHEFDVGAALDFLSRRLPPRSPPTPLASTSDMAAMATGGEDR